jgi:uncharacterized protein
MTVLEPPKIAFPCENYPIKVLGEADHETHCYVLDIIERHAPGFDQTRITISESSKGRFRSVTVWITATGEPQLRAINDDLRISKKIKMVM